MDPNTYCQADVKNHEWMKNKLSTLWTARQYCGLCLETSGNFYAMKMEFAINECYSTMPLRNVISDVLNVDIDDYTANDVICEQCTEMTIQSYVFIQNTKKVFEILNNCVSDVLSKVMDISNELDDNVDFDNANVMIVVEYDDEIYSNVNEITTGNNTILTDKPITKESPTCVPTKVIVENKSTPVEEIPVESKQARGPVIVPTPRVVKHPRKEVPIVHEKVVKTSSPTVTLEGGKIVIAPLTTNTQATTKFNPYKCNSCGSIFTTYRALKEHEKSVHNTTIFQCRFCHKKYNSQQYLDVHYMAAHTVTRCRYCTSLVDNNYLNCHLSENHKMLVNSCKYCELVYYTEEQLETHCKSAHMGIEAQQQTNKNKTQCVMCLRSFRDEEIVRHKCKFSCLECPVVPCVHYSYLMSYREQVLSHATKIRCLDCDYTTKRKEHLVAHVNREHLDYHPFTCDDCGTQFYTKLSLKTHIGQFHQDLKCQYCDHEFVNMKLLSNHKELCKAAVRPYGCEKCVASFDTQPELNKHQKFSHSNIVFPCTLCKKEFINETALEEHHARVHNGIQYKKRRKFIECTLCDITFKNIKELLQHEELHDPKEEYPCKECSKSFTSLKKVYMHKQRHYSQRTKCPGCNKRLVSTYFMQHKAICPYLKEPRELPFVCSMCGKAFHLESSLNIHEQLHSKAKPCQYCNKLIKPSSMKKHMQIKHKNLEVTYPKVDHQVYKCEYCEYTTKKKIEFENHVNKAHLMIKPYVCQVCKKAFCGKSRLDEHMKTHNEDNVCFCTYCGKKFANRVCLKMHTRRHTGEKPYECNICFERFRSSSIMKTHRVKKHHDKTIQCPLCDSMYHLAIEMRHHVKKAHWKRPEPFDYKVIVPVEYQHMFEDRRLQKLGEDINTPGAEE